MPTKNYYIRTGIKINKPNRGEAEKIERKKAFKQFGIKYADHKKLGLHPTNTKTINIANLRFCEENPNKIQEFKKAQSLIGQKVRFKGKVETVIFVSAVNKKGHWHFVARLEGKKLNNPPVITKLEKVS